MTDPYPLLSLLPGSQEPVGRGNMVGYLLKWLWSLTTLTPQPHTHRKANQSQEWWLTPEASAFERSAKSEASLGYRLRSYPKRPSPN